MVGRFVVLALLLLTHSRLWAETRPEMSYRLKASVVKVHVATRNGGHGVGSGVAISKDMVATNCHVLANSIGVKITTFGTGLVPVALKADWKHDICILRFELTDFKPVELGDSEHLQYEQEIFSIGFPGGMPKPLYTEGSVKALYPFEDSVIIRTSASFVLGASGSPVFDADGKMVAISTFKSPGRHAYYYNIPVKWVKAALKLPDTTSMATNDSPFWDAPEVKQPFFMRVVPPYLHEKWDDLEKIAMQWISSDRHSAEGHYYAGVAAEKLGNIREAKAHYQQALSIQPKHAAALAALDCLGQTNPTCDSRFQ